MSIFYITPKEFDNKDFTQQQVASKIEQIAQDFEQKLHSRGGNLTLLKCFWYLVHWVWDDKGNAYLQSTDDSPASIHLTQGSFTTKYLIKREDTNTSIRTIRVSVNPQGINTTEYNYRLQYTKKWSTMIQTSRLTPKEVQRAYRIVYIPSITYPMGAVYFTLEQCQSLQNTASQAYLPKLGFNQKFPKEILYAPASMGGWGKKDLFIHLATQQTKIFLGYILNRDETGKLLPNKLEYTQQYSGYTHPILNRKTPTKFFNWTPDTWITNYKRILHILNGEMVVNNVWIPKLLCKKDVALMEYFSIHIEERATLKLINNCQMYLQIFTLAEMCSSDGTKFTKCSLYGHRNPSFHTLLHWPKQKRPSNFTWATFRSILCTHFCIPNSLQLLKPLGPWKQNQTSDTKWNHFYDKTTRRVYIHHDRKYGAWTFHRPISSETLLFNCSPGMPQLPPPYLHKINLDSFTDNSWIFCKPT